MSSPAPSALAWAFAVVAAVLFTALTLGLAASRLHASTDELIASTQRENRLAVTMLAGALAQELDRGDLASRPRPGSSLEVTPEIAQFLDKAVDGLWRDSSIVKVKLLDAYGTIMYSSRPEELGTVTLHPAAIQRALAGLATSHMSRRERFQGRSSALRDVDIVETYLPFSSRGASVDAVIEIYSDVTSTFDALRARQAWEKRTFAGVALATYLFLLLLVLCGGRVLRASEQLAADRTIQAQEATRFLHEGIESMTEGIAFWDDQHRLLKFNRRYLEILPHLRGFIRLGMTLREINEHALRADTPGIDEAEVAARVTERLAARQEPGRVWTHELSTGRIVDIIDHKTPAGGYVTIFRDVTESKRAERRLAESEARLRDAIESIGDGFVMFDGGYRVILWNRRYIEILPFLDGKLRVGMHARELLERLAESDAYGIPPSQRQAWVDANVERRTPDRRVYQRDLTDGRRLEGSVHETGMGGFALVLRDITEPSRIQAALAESESRFRDFASATADWFWEMDERLRFTFISESNYAITGMRPEEFYASSPLDFRPDGVTDQDWEVHLEALRARAPFKDFRFRATGPDRVTRIVATSGQPVFDAHGRFRGYRGVGTDITPVIEAQTRAEASEALLRDGIEGMASGLIMFDGRQEVVLWNSRYVELFPYLRDVMRKGMPARELLRLHAESPQYGLRPEERAAWIDDRLSHDPGGGSELQQTLADGRILRVSGTMSRTGGEIYVVRDATAEIAGQQRLERTLVELRRSQEEVRRLALVAQHTDNAVVITDERGVAEWVNAAFTRFSGYSFEEIVGRRPGQMLQGPDTDPQTVAAMRDALSRGDGFRVEVLNYAKDGRPYWLEIDCSPVRDEAGKVVRFIAVEADITERKQQERLLATALERERNAALQQRRFVSVAAHEFRTPLTIIDGAAQRLLRYADKMTPDDLRDRSRRIRNAVQRMSQLIDTTLNTARLDEGRIELNLGTVDVVQLISSICQRGDGFAPEFRFAIETTAPSLPIQADPRLIEQVFTNLLSNAVKYSGGSRRIDIALRGDAQAVEIAVRDFGIGVPEAEVGQLFTRFYRATTAKGLPGTGIGLNLVRELVRLHGGEVSVRSAVGLGSTFTVRLPVSVDNARIATLAPAAE